MIYDSGMKAFPARLPQQPIFYPVLQLAYARQTASDWNAKNGQFAGYVTQFKMEEDYIGQFEPHTVGNSEYQEFWISAEKMEEFNRHIIGHIKVLEAHFGDAFQGFVPEAFGLQGKNAVEQFTLLANSYLYKRMEFYLEIKRNHKSVFLNYPFWQTYEFKNPGLKEKIIQAIKEAWSTSFPKIPLPNPVEKEATPSKQTDAPSYEDITLVEQIDSNPSVNPVPEEFRSVKQTNLRASVKPVRENIVPIQEPDSDSLAHPVHEDIPLIKQTYANSLINPVPEIAPEEQSDPDALTDPIDEAITPEEQDDSQVLVSPVTKASLQPRQADDSHFVQGVELGLRGKYQEAIAEFSKAIEEDPDHVAAQTSLGVAFRRLGEENRALSRYEAALRIDPVYAEAHYFRANILFSFGNVREAIAGYTIAIGLQPELIAAHKKPVPQDRLTDYSPAPAEMNWIAKPAHRILDLNESLTTHPRQAGVLKERAAEYYRLRNYVQAIADYSSSLEIQSQDASVFYSRGIAYEQIGQTERALEDYQQAIAINPQLADEYIHRGVTFGQIGQFRQSIASLTEGIRLSPQNPDAYFNRGTSYFQLGDFEKAIEDFSNVIRLSPKDETAYYWRGISQETVGQQREAIADYRQFLTLSQDENARIEVEQKLSQWEGKNQDNSGTARDWLGKLGELMRNKRIVPGNQQETIQVPPEELAQSLDVYDLATALGERALNSVWFGRGVECSGENAEELYAFTDQDKPIEGHDFLYITSGIRQTIQGDFQALDPDATSPWIFIRAWQGNGFYIETDDPKIKERLMTHFPWAEEVDGASPSYEGLFIRI